MDARLDENLETKTISAAAWLELGKILGNRKTFRVDCYRFEMKRKTVPSNFETTTDFSTTTEIERIFITQQPGIELDLILIYLIDCIHLHSREKGNDYVSK